MCLKSAVITRGKQIFSAGWVTAQRLSMVGETVSESFLWLRAEVKDKFCQDERDMILLHRRTSLKLYWSEIERCFHFCQTGPRCQTGSSEPKSWTLKKRNCCSFWIRRYFGLSSSPNNGDFLFRRPQIEGTGCKMLVPEQHCASVCLSLTVRLHHFHTVLHTWYTPYHECCDVEKWVEREGERDKGGLKPCHDGFIATFIRIRILLKIFNELVTNQEGAIRKWHKSSSVIEHWPNINHKHIQPITTVYYIYVLPHVPPCYCGKANAPKCSFFYHESMSATFCRLHWGRGNVGLILKGCDVC